MTTTLVFSSTNYFNKTADIVFYPLTGGGPINIGTFTLPYTYITSDYYIGEYQLFFPQYNKTCIVNVSGPPAPSQTPTPTGKPNPTLTPTQTPTLTPTPTPTITLPGFNTTFNLTTPDTTYYTGFKGTVTGMEVFTDVPAPYTVKIEVQAGAGTSTTGPDADVYIDIPVSGTLPSGTFNVYFLFSPMYDGKPIQIEIWNGTTKVYVFGAASSADTSVSDYVFDQTISYSNFGTSWTPRWNG